MKVTITKNQLLDLIKEEVVRHQRIEELEADKKLISEFLKKIDAGEEIDEVSWGGIKNVLSKGAQSIGRNIGQAGQTVKQGFQGLGQDFKDVGNMAYKGVKNAANQVSQTYKQGEEMAAKKTAQNQVSNIHSKIKQLQAQYNQLSAQYQQLTGKPYNAKAVAAPAQYRRAQQNTSAAGGSQTTSNAA